MGEKLSTEKYEMPGFGSKSPLGKEGFAPVKPKSIVSAEEKEPKKTQVEKDREDNIITDADAAAVPTFSDFIDEEKNKQNDPDHIRATKINKKLLK